MRASEINEFRELVLSSDLGFECQEEHLKKLSFSQLITLWESLLDEYHTSNLSFNCVVTSHYVKNHMGGDWIGISICEEENPSIGISRSIKVD